MGEQGSRAEQIAVVGMALRVPGAVSLQQFWQNILAGTDSLARPNNEVLRRAGVSRRQLADPKLVRSGPVLDDIEYFDASFFDMTDFEAERTEPAFRLFLECAWEAFEAAGLVSVKTGLITGVFAGGEGSYRKHQLQHLNDRSIHGELRVPDRGKELPLHLGNSLDFLSARVSHKLDLTGASFSLVAACATSLVAIHLAVQSLRRRECEVAIAGGATVLEPNVGAYISSIEGMFSSSGRIRPFDADADGTIFGSGVGVVVLRPLEDAIADRNPIWGVVRGSGVSNDGNPPGKESFIAPSRSGQIAAVEAAMSDAGVTTETIGYLEAHGTATLLGDPIEVASIGEVYRRDTASKGYCALGSVKGNVGHLRTAAGAISFIKTCLALKHRVLPPVANFAKHNPRIDFESSPFFVNTKPLEWAAGAYPRRAAVSSFGFGGANAHVIVDEHVETAVPASSRRRHLLTLSAKSETALTRRIADLATCLDENPDLKTADVAHTLQCGRTPMPHRACIYINEEAAKPATKLRSAPNVMGTAKGEDRPVVFLFPGQGAQRPGMGQDIYEREPLYRETVDRCASLLEPKLGLDIRTLIHSQSGSIAGSEALRRTANAQPALFVVGYALARQFMSWGVRPMAMLGHSIGEIVAACVADVFSLEDALTLVSARARLMQACDPGAMAAVFLPEERLKDVLVRYDLEVAALNTPNISVVSGPEPNVARFVDEMKNAGVGTRRIETSHAFHSRMMDPALSAFRSVLQGIELSAPKIPIISNATGLVLTKEQATDPEYWSHHLRHTVRFTGGAAHLLNNGNDVFLELGPGRTLCDLIRQHDSEADVFAALEHDHEKNSAQEPHSALMTLGRVWCAGANVDWRAFYGEEPRQKLTLPTYPFERRRYWIEPGNFETKADKDSMLYEPGWRLAELEHDEPEDDGRAWLIFEDEHGLGRTIVQKLEAQGRSFITLTPGDAFAETGPHSFSARPASKEDMSAAIAKARARDSGLAPRILHLWSVTGPTGPHNTIEGFQQSNQTGFYTLIALTQAAYDIGMNIVDITVVADGLRHIEGEDTPLYAEKGALFGPVRNIGNEIRGMSFRCVDISGFAETQPIDELCSAIIAEAVRPSSQQTICLRPTGRYVEEFYPFSAPPLGRFRLRHGGTVLITGGLGALGLKLARELFDAARARLVLTSRSKMPPREEWPSCAAQNDHRGHVLRELLALEDRGAEVLVVAADMGDIDSLKAAVAEAESCFGAINGVVHAAGTNPDGPALNSTPEIVEPAFEAKVHGAFYLEEIFAEASLDFFVYLSSCASFLVKPGQTIYTASNSVLDILSQRRSLSQPGLNCAIGWGAWQEMGMAALIAERRVREPKGQSLNDSGQGVPLVIQHPLLGRKHQGANGSFAYRSALRDGDHWVLEHRYKGHALIAGATILECLRASYVDLLGAEIPVEFSQLAFFRPMFVHDNGIELEIEYMPNGDRQRVTVRSRPIGHGDDWTIHAMGLAAPAQPPSTASITIPDDVPDTGLVHLQAENFVVGPRWECVVGAKIDRDVMWARMRLGEQFRKDVGLFGLHTAMFDRALNDPSKKYGVVGVPYTLDKIGIYGRLGPEFFARSTRRVVNNADSFDALFVDSDGTVVVETQGFVTREAKGSSLEDSPIMLSDESKVDNGAIGPNRRIVITHPGKLDSIQLCQFEPRSPGEGEVQIDVVAAGLNFRDVLLALGQMPTDGHSHPRIGGECSGIVSVVGEGVVGISPGDPVVALARDSFAGSVTVPTDLVLPVPSNICMEDAAGIPIVFLTADYAINRLAGLKKGERILIHAAAGGVGLAAVQMAKAIGAEIFATAGHPDKRKYLKSLGVENVMDSRSLDFVQETRKLTKGEGVDVVLNSLAGEFIPAGLSLLRYRGRFLEIGKRDILSDSKMGLLPFQNNLSYHAIDLGPMIQRCDPVLVEMFDELMLRFTRGDLMPIPTAVIPITDIAKAMQRMARAEHIGKIVLKVQDDTDPWRSIFKTFQELYGHGIPVNEGLSTFRQLLSANSVPYYVMALGEKIDDVGQAKHRVGGKRNTRPRLPVEYRAPTTVDEEKLVRIWENAIGVAPIGIYDDFFDLGGDSIIAIQTQFSVADEFGISLSTSAFFDFPTVASLAEQIRKL